MIRRKVESLADLVFAGVGVIVEGQNGESSGPLSFNFKNSNEFKHSKSTHGPTG
jgi:hypothetical protein